MLRSPLEPTSLRRNEPGADPPGVQLRQRTSVGSSASPIMTSPLRTVLCCTCFACRPGRRSHTCLWIALPRLVDPGRVLCCRWDIVWSREATGGWLRRAMLATMELDYCPLSTPLQDMKKHAVGSHVPPRPRGSSMQCSQPLVGSFKVLRSGRSDPSGGGGGIICRRQLTQHAVIRKFRGPERALAGAHVLRIVGKRVLCYITLDRGCMYEERKTLAGR